MTSRHEGGGGQGSAARMGAVFRRHDALACVGIAIAVAAVLVGVFAFLAFSGFGASADFIYNQF